MRTNTGIKSGIDKDIMKDLKKGDVLYSAVYDNGCGRTSIEKFVFDEYVKQPVNSKGVWAKYAEVVLENEDGTYELAKKVHRGEDGKETEEIAWRVNDISIGLFLDPLSALKAWEKVAFNIYSSAKRAVSDQEAKEKKSN